MTPPTAAEVDELDAEYLAVVALASSKPPPLSEPDALSRHRQAGFQATAAADRLCQAITDHDIAVYGEPFPEEETTPCPSSLPSP